MRKENAMWKLAAPLLIVWSESGSHPLPAKSLPGRSVASAHGQEPPASSGPAGSRDKPETRKDEIMNQFILTLLRVLGAWTT